MSHTTIKKLCHLSVFNYCDTCLDFSDIVPIQESLLSLVALIVGYILYRILRTDVLNLSI